MKKVFLTIGTAFLLLISTAVTSFGLTIATLDTSRSDKVSNNIDYVLKYTNLTEYLGYDGDLLGVFEGNDSEQLSGIEDWLIANEAYDSAFKLVEEGKEEYEIGNATIYGEWTFQQAVSLYVVKAGDGFALYKLNPSLDKVNWNTYDLWAHGLGSDNNGIEVSHLTGYNPSPVPEPATMALFGLGLIGIAGIGRKTRKN